MLDLVKVSLLLLYVLVTTGDGSCTCQPSVVDVPFRSISHQAHLLQNLVADS